MGKVLRVLVYVIFALGVGALVLAVINFKFREELVGRTHALEEAVVKIAGTLESQDPADVPQPSFPQRDTSPVTSRELDNPEVSAFWDSYNSKYEPSAQPIPPLNYGSQDLRMQLRQLYQLDGEGKPVLDPMTGLPSTKGKGTLAELLDQAFQRAVAQYALLNKVRAELPKLREELVSTIEELNRVKREGRADKKTIESLNARVAQLEDEKRGLERRIETLEQEKRELNAELTEAKAEIAKRDEQITTMNGEIERLNRRIRELIDTQGPTGTQRALETNISPGEKGRIVSANEQWKFVVVQLNDAFMTELLGPDKSQPMPPVELMVRRPGFQGPAGDFVARIKLRQVIVDQNIVIADTLMDWQQAPVKDGDIVYF